MFETPNRVGQPWNSSSPPVDVVIPTLNCKQNLVHCLERLRAQDYCGDTRIIVVDGGSTDGTADVALQFGCELIVRPGIYGTGLTGARHLGESSGNAPLIWLVDSDNFIKEDGAEAALVRPLVEDPSLSFSVPLPYIDRSTDSFNQWLNMFERDNIISSAREGRRMSGWIQVADMTHGLSNCTMIRRLALEAGGGYDSDVRLLRRLRMLGLSSCAVVPSSHFIHNQTSGALDFARKTRRRLQRFGRMSSEELTLYFADTPVSRRKEKPEFLRSLKELASAPAVALKGFSSTGDSSWLWGVVFPILIAMILLSIPRTSAHVYSRFF